MNVQDPSIRALEAMVTAMTEEFDLATSFHEIWKPAVADSDLHKRMGKSYATQAFLVIRMALRREMLLALTRMWDSNKQGQRMKSARRHRRARSA